MGSSVYNGSRVWLVGGGGGHFQVAPFGAQMGSYMSSN